MLGAALAKLLVAGQWHLFDELSVEVEHLDDGRASASVDVVVVAFHDDVAGFVRESYESAGGTELAGRALLDVDDVRPHVAGVGTPLNQNFVGVVGNEGDIGGCGNVVEGYFHGMAVFHFLPLRGSIGIGGEQAAHFVGVQVVNPYRNHLGLVILVGFALYAGVDVGPYVVRFEYSCCA